MSESKNNNYLPLGWILIYIVLLATYGGRNTPRVYEVADFLQTPSISTFWTLFMYLIGFNILVIGVFIIGLIAWKKRNNPAHKDSGKDLCIASIIVFIIATIVFLNRPPDQSLEKSGKKIVNITKEYIYKKKLVPLEDDYSEYGVMNTFVEAFHSYVNELGANMEEMNRELAKYALTLDFNENTIKNEEWVETAKYNIGMSKSINKRYGKKHIAIMEKMRDELTGPEIPEAVSMGAMQSFKEDIPGVLEEIRSYFNIKEKIFTVAFNLITFMEINKDLYGFRDGEVVFRDYDLLQQYNDYIEKASILAAAEQGKMEGLEILSKKLMGKGFKKLGNIAVE